MKIHHLLIIFLVFSRYVSMFTVPPQVMVMVTMVVPDAPIEIQKHHVGPRWIAKLKHLALLKSGVWSWWIYESS